MLRKRVRSALLLAGILGLSGIACPWSWGAEEPEQPERFINKEKGFSLVLPKGWKQKTDGIAPVMALSPQEGPKDQFPENINVIVDSLPQPVPVEAVATSAIAFARKAMKDLKVLGRGSLMVEGNETRWWAFEHRVAERRLKAQQFIFVSGTRYYVITCSALPTTFARYKPHFEKSVKSFRFEE